MNADKKNDQRQSVKSASSAFYSCTPNSRSTQIKRAISENQLNQRHQRSILPHHTKLKEYSMRRFHSYGPVDGEEHFCYWVGLTIPARWEKNSTQITLITLINADKRAISANQDNLPSKCFIPARWEKNSTLITLITLINADKKLKISAHQFNQRYQRSIRALKR